MLQLWKLNVFRKLYKVWAAAATVQLHAHTRTYADIFNDSDNLLYHYKCGICIYQKYIYHYCVYHCAACIIDKIWKLHILIL